MFIYYIMKIILDGYIFKKSKNKLKKYDVFNLEGDKIVSFGAIKPTGEPYAQYRDKIGLYKKYDHKDKKRRDRYYKRHGETDNKKNAKYFSHKYLW
jgi:hypothetical protein